MTSTWGWTWVSPYCGDALHNELNLVNPQKRKFSEAYEYMVKYMDFKILKQGSDLFCYILSKVYRRNLVGESHVSWDGT